jgi:hypothetical protein
MVSALTHSRASLAGGRHVPPGEGEFALRQELGQDGPGASVERHFEAEIQAVGSSVAPLAPQREPPPIWLDGVDRDLGDTLVFRPVHGNLQTR